MRTEPQILADLIRFSERLERTADAAGSTREIVHIDPVQLRADAELVEQARKALHERIVRERPGQKASILGKPKPPKPIVLTSDANRAKIWLRENGIDHRSVSIVAHDWQIAGANLGEAYRMLGAPPSLIQFAGTRMNRDPNNESAWLTLDQLKARAQ